MEEVKRLTIVALLFLLKKSICSMSSISQDSAAIQVISNESTPLIAKQQNGRGSTSAASAQHDHHKRREIVGLLYMTLSALGFSTMSLFVKLSGTSFPSFEIVFARSVVQTLLGFLGCAILKINPFGERGVRKWLLFRGLAGTLGLCLFFYSITQLPLADATGISHTHTANHFIIEYIYVYIDGYIFSCIFPGSCLHCYPCSDCIR